MKAGEFGVNRITVADGAGEEANRQVYLRADGHTVLSSRVTASGSITGHIPTEGLGVDGNITATGTVAANRGAYSQSLTVSGTPVALANKSFVAAGVFIFGESTNLAINDHVKWTRGKTVGSNIAADFTTTYASGTGASLGRFTLQPNRTYQMVAALQCGFSGAASATRYTWTTADGSNLTAVDPSAISTVGISLPTSFGLIHASDLPSCMALVTPTTVTGVQVMFTEATGLSSYSAASYAWIQEIG